MWTHPLDWTRWLVCAEDLPSSTPQALGLQPSDTMATRNPKSGLLDCWYLSHSPAPLISKLLKSIYIYIYNLILCYWKYFILQSSFKRLPLWERLAYSVHHHLHSTWTTACWPRRSVYCWLIHQQAIYCIIDYDRNTRCLGYVQLSTIIGNPIYLGG